MKRWIWKFQGRSFKVGTLLLLKTILNRYHSLNQQWMGKSSNFQRRNMIKISLFPSIFDIGHLLETFKARTVVSTSLDQKKMYTSQNSTLLSQVLHTNKGRLSQELCSSLKTPKMVQKQTYFWECFKDKCIANGLWIWEEFPSLVKGWKWLWTSKAKISTTKGCSILTLMDYRCRKGSSTTDLLGTGLDLKTSLAITIPCKLLLQLKIQLKSCKWQLWTLALKEVHLFRLVA